MEQDPFAMTKQMAGALGLDLSIGALVVSTLFNIVGWYVFKLGRKHERPGVLWSGVLLMVYPLFVSGTMNIAMAGAGLCAAAYYFWTRDEA